MDNRIEEIIKSLLCNIETLDSTLMRISRSDVFTPDTQCFGLLEQIRDSCISTLQVTRAIEHKLQSAAFIIPPHIVATLE